MKAHIRTMMADHHVAAIAIALLLLRSIIWGFSGLWPLISDALGDVLTAIAIFDIPAVSYSGFSRLQLATIFVYFFGAFVSFVVAYGLSLWVYGVGPVRALARYRELIPRREM